jgi:hypothetical protein
MNRLALMRINRAPFASVDAALAYEPRAKCHSERVLSKNHCLATKNASTPSQLLVCQKLPPWAVTDKHQSRTKQAMIQAVINERAAAPLPIC